MLLEPALVRVVPVAVLFQDRLIHVVKLQTPTASSNANAVLVDVFFQETQSRVELQVIGVECVVVKWKSMDVAVHR